MLSSSLVGLVGTETHWNVRLRVSPAVPVGDLLLVLRAFFADGKSIDVDGTVTVVPPTPIPSEAEPFPWLAGQPVTVTLGLVYGYVPYMVLALFAGLDRVDQRLLEAARDLGASRRRTFLLVTLPLSRQAILAGLVVTALPMFGDYFTNDLLSGSPRTSMVGNLVNDAVSSPGQGGQAAALVLVMIALLAVPMLGYVRSTARASREAGR